MDTSTPSTEHPEKAPKNIPIELLIEYRKKKLSFGKIGKLVGCHKSNVLRRLNQFKGEIEGLDSFKENKADILSIFQSKIINNITPSDIKNASLLQKTTAVCQLYDKERLELGKSTSNLAVQSVATDLQALLDRLQVEEDARKTINITPDNDDPLPPQIAQSLGSE